MLTGEEVCSQARTWLGTRFRHQGRLKKSCATRGGVDCLGLLMGVASELKLASRQSYGKLLIEFDETSYSRMPDGIYLQRLLKEHLHEIRSGEISTGDVLLFRLDGNPQHLAIAGGNDSGMTLIHSYLEARAVVESTLAEPWISRLVGCYRISSVKTRR